MKPGFLRLFTAGKPLPWLEALLVAAAVLVFLGQALNFAHTTPSSLDEGAYLYKGYLYATGQYQPFEPYGPQTNKAPLSFLIPGYVQLIFGPGLRTGRYLAVAFAVLTVLVTWIAARRLAGAWLAVGAAWSFALNPALIRIYSEAVSQSEVAFLLALILALSLGKERPAWQLVLAGLLAGLISMVRQNMVIVLPVLVLYLWWQYGWRLALGSAAAGLAVMAIFHVLYWPYVMQLWLPWLPRGMRTWFPGAMLSGGGSSFWRPDITPAGRLLSITQALRLHFVVAAGFLLGLSLWPRKSSLGETRFRAALFLSVLFIGLVAMHSWASLSKDYCVFCLTPYLAFFSVAAILFLAVMLAGLVKHPHPLRQLIVDGGVLVLFTGVGYSAFEDIGDWLLALNVPRVREGRILPGFTSLWDLISNKFGFERNLAEKIVSSAAGLLLGLLLMLLAYLAYRALRRWGLGYAYVLAVCVLALGLLFSPLLAGSAGRPECPGMDVIANNEEVGRYLHDHIAPGSRVYWNGGLSVAPMLYASEARMYLPQINDGYAHRAGEDAELLLKFGFWNDAMEADWFNQADYVIVEGWRYADMKNRLDPAIFDELPRSPVQTSCLKGSGLRIFIRK